MTAWTSPRTWVTGELVTAALMNTHVRDNLLHLKESVTTLETTATNTTAYLPRGHFAGLHVRTHPDADQAAAKIMLIVADEIMMSDGVRSTGWAGQTADLSASGANGLDTGAEAASTWYSFHAIQKSSDGTKALLFHKAPLWNRDQTQDLNSNTMALRDATARTRLGQTFQVAAAGSLAFVDLRLIRSSGTPSGRVWAEIYSDSAGAPNTLLATSDKLLSAQINNGGHDVRFVFRAPTSVATSTTYHLVLQGDYTINGADYLAWAYQSATNPYASGVLEHYNGVAWTTVANDDFRFRIWLTSGTAALTMPTGYDQSCLIGYAYNDGSSNLRAFIQQQRGVRYSTPPALVSAVQATPPTLVDASALIPPTPCGVSLRVSSTTGAGDVIVGPVPEGYSPSAGADIFATYSGAEGGSLPPLLTENQGLYYRSTVTASVGVEGFEWLR